MLGWKKIFETSATSIGLFILQGSLFLCNPAECVLSAQLEMMWNIRKKRRREIQAGDVSVLETSKKKVPWK